MQQIIALFIPIIGILSVSALIVILKRLEHIEKLKMIEQGLDISKFQKPHKPGGALKFALMLIGVGLGLFFASLLESYTTIEDEVLYFSMIFIFAGSGLYLGDTIADKKIKENQKEAQ